MDTSCDADSKCSSGHSNQGDDDLSGDLNPEELVDEPLDPLESLLPEIESMLSETSLREAKRLIRKLTRERDHHRMEHRRLVTERDRLAKDMKRLAVHYGKEKYETLVKEKTLLRIERDRLQEKLKTVSDTNKSLEDDGEKTRITKKTSGLVWSAWPKWSGKPTALSASKRQEVLSISEEASVHAHQGPVSCVNGQSSVDHLVSGGDDGIVKIFDCSDISNVTLLGALEGGHSSFVSSVRYYSSRVISSGGDGCVILWDVSSGSILTKIKQHASCVWSVDVRDPYLVTGSMDHSAKLIDLNVGRARRAFRAHVDSVNSVKLFKKNSMITGSADKSVSIWDVRTAHCEHTLYWHKTAAVNCVAGGSTLIASGDMHGNVCITDIRNVSIPLCVYGGHGVCVNSLDWTDDGGDDVVAIASRDGSIKLFSVLKNAIVYSTVDGNGQTDVLCVTSTCGKSRLLSSDSAGFLKIWTTSSSSSSSSTS